jgi:HEAT repeat protein
LPEELAVNPDDPREERLAFVRATARTPHPDGLDELALLLLEDEDATIRAAAAGALGRLRGGEAGEALISALDDRDRRVRRAAARAFGAVGGERAIEALERVLLEERASEVRRMAPYALSRMGNEPALAALEIARSDRDRTVRNIAEAALTRAQD